MAARKRPLRADKLKCLPVGRLERGRLQPRKAIDGMGLQKLAESVRSNGIVQPLFVRQIARNKFEIVAGERRWHAAKMAGLKTVPTLVRNVSDEAALSISLLENLHREDLNPLDQACAVRSLIEDFSMTHQEVADTLGKSRATVTNLLRLLDLSAEVQTMLADGQIDFGHARALRSLPDERQLAAAQQVVAGALSVRDVERLVRDPDAIEPNGSPGGEESKLPWLWQWLRDRLDKRIRVKQQKDRSWCLNIAFTDLDELRSALQTLESLLEDCEPEQRNVGTN